MRIYSEDSNVKTLEYLRGMRDEALAESDWTQMPDSPLSNSKKTEWATYRQQLRDLTNGVTDETNLSSIIFPTKPT